MFLRGRCNIAVTGLCSGVKTDVYLLAILIAHASLYPRLFLK